MFTTNLLCPTLSMSGVYFLKFLKVILQHHKTNYTLRKNLSLITILNKITNIQPHTQLTL
jgi:hypothetical protein